jgi:hypothetical protein
MEVASQLKLFNSWVRYSASPFQLWPAPAPLYAFPLTTEEGRFCPSLLFRGSIARKAHSQRNLLQVSRLARGLCAGFGDLLDKATDDHFKVVTSTPIVEPIIIHHFETASEHISNKGVFRGIEKLNFTLSESACYENSVRRGGSAGYIRDSISREGFSTRYFWRRKTDPNTLTVLLSSANAGEELSIEWMDASPYQLRDIRLTAYEWCVAEAFSNSIIRDGRFLFQTPESRDRPESPILPQMATHKVCTLPDRGGFKVRVITAGPAAMNSLSHTVRKVLYKTLLTRLPTNWALYEGGLEEFFEQLSLPIGHGRYGEWVLLSSDLKAATDLFPFELMQATNRGFESHMNDSQKHSPNWLAWKALSGPQKLVYGDRRTGVGADDFALLSVVTTCGNMMGTPPSWIHLNVFNTIVFRLAWSIWASRVGQRSLKRILFFCKTKEELVESGDWVRIRDIAVKVMNGKDFHPFIFPKSFQFNKLVCIMGDDLGSACPFAVAVLYEIIIELSNGKTSPGKHFVQRFVPGAYLLVAERFCSVHEDYTVRVQPTISIRGIPSTITAFDNQSNHFDWAQMGKTLTDCLNCCSTDQYRPLCSYAHLLNHKWRIILTHCGFPLYLPTFVGGLGWPHPRGELYGLGLTSLTNLRMYSAIRGYRQDPIRFFSLLGTLSSLYAKKPGASHYGTLVNLYTSFFSRLIISRDIHGGIADIVDGTDVGWMPQDDHLEGVYDFSIYEPLYEVMDNVILSVLPSFYLTENVRSNFRASVPRSYLFHHPDLIDMLRPDNFREFELPNPDPMEFRSISASAKNFRHVRERILRTRKTWREFSRPTSSDVKSWIDEDKTMMDNLYVRIDLDVCNRMSGLFDEYEGRIRRLLANFVHHEDEGL